MSISDPIADFLTRIRNAIMAGNQNVSVPSAKIKVALAKILVEEGFIDGFEQVSVEGKPQDVLRIHLKYVGERRNRKPVISGLKRVSKPGRRIYVGRGEIPWVQSGLGIAILTTPKGVVTGVRARKLGVGGEVLCEVW
ncbi:MAG: 30S ribosomal protein S8 [Anaerolineales bacterium]|jgi:small subunit ribosomal protein S8|nr:30S ribosomal protein S8 [Anaerolineales bacterium]MCK5317287.1 30S ribosomal protein S8 [Anaerolineales bacterium]TET96337.1 MAG: 30S ribosomal protein S8 [Anaerolineales bacterium]